MAALSDSRILAMLLTLCVGTFVATSSGSALAPFLRMVAQDWHSDLATVAHLFGFQAITWGTASLLAGIWSERLGRKPVLVVSLATLGAARILFALSDTYPMAVVWQLLSGLAGGAFMGTVFATVSDHVPSGKRGRSLSWIITGQSLSLLLGVPLITLLGSFGGWRGALGTHGAATIFCTLFVLWVVPRGVAVAHDPKRVKVPLTALFRPRLISLLAAGMTERICFAMIAMFIPAYMQHAYGVELRELAAALAVIALGTFLGNLVGGRIADTTRSRPRLFARASLATALVAFPTFLWQPGLLWSVLLGFTYSFVNAMGRPALLATISDVPSEIRGAVFGIQITTASMGWLLAASVGAVLIASSQFAGLGLFATGLALAGAVLAWWAGRMKE